jgi:hypothetical protein
MSRFLINISKAESCQLVYLDHLYLLSVCLERFQDGDYREEAENMLPKVKSWRDG